jgi:polyphenol oxidase
VQERQVGSVKFYQFISFENHGLYHAVFTRNGGVSPAPWKSLNFGATVGDDGLRVNVNKQYAFESIGKDRKSIYDVYQVHSSEVVHTDRPLHQGEPHIKADAMITNKPGVSLVMRFADCGPILMFDPTHQAIGIAHAGWIGTVNKIAENTLLKMKNRFATNPQDVLAAIGPSIGPDHYSVRSDVVDQVISAFGKSSDELLIYDQDTIYLDLWKANRNILNNAGVVNIEIAEMCTNCRIEDWYSHRGENGKTGRFGVVFGLSE